MTELELQAVGEAEGSALSRSSMPFTALRKRIAGLAGSDAPDIPWRFSVGFAIAVTIAELVTALLDPQWGLVLHGSLLLALPLWTALRWRYPDHRLALAFTLVPLIRVLSLSLPLARFPIFTWYALTAAPLTVSAYVVRRMLGLSRRHVGFTVGRWYVQLLVALPGVVFGLVEYWILRPEPLISELTFKTAWFPAVSLLLATGLTEEYVFRGVLQNVSMDILGPRGLMLVTLIFAALHVGYLSLLDMLFVFIVGLYFAWASFKTGSILGVTVAHGVTNIVLFLIVPFLGVLAPAPPHANSQFPLSLSRRRAVTTPVAAPRATSTPTPTRHSWSIVTMVASLETPMPTASPEPTLDQAQATLIPTAPAVPTLEYVPATPTPTASAVPAPDYASATATPHPWGVPVPRLKDPWAMAKVFVSPVRLSWEWYRALSAGEYFEVSLWSSDNLVIPVGTMLAAETYCDFDFTPYPSGRYYWGVRVVVGHVDNGEVVVDGPRSLIGTNRLIHWEPAG